MTLFATLLLSKPVRLPVGTARTHYMDGSLPRQSSVNTTLRTRSIGLVEQAIAYDFKSRDEIQAITRLSAVTIVKVVGDLVDEGRAVVDTRRGRRGISHKLFYKMKDES